MSSKHNPPFFLFRVASLNFAYDVVTLFLIASRFYQVYYVITLSVLTLIVPAGVHSMVATRDQVVHYKKADRVRPNTRTVDEPPEDIPEGSVYFRPGMVPAQKQIFYQVNIFCCQK